MATKFQVQPTDIKKVESELYIIPGIKTPDGDAVFLYCRDNRRVVRKDYGWYVSTAGEAKKESMKLISAFCHDRRSKAIDELNARIKKGEFMLGEPSITLPEKMINGGVKSATARYVPPKTRELEPLTVSQLIDKRNTILQSLGYTPISAKFKGRKTDLISEICNIRPQRARRVTQNEERIAA